MGRLRRVCIYYIGGMGVLLLATAAHADFFGKPGEVAAMQSQARQSAAHILAQAYQLSGMKEMTANLAHRYVGEALSQKMSTWVGEAISQVFAEHKGPTLSQKVNDPAMRAEIQARIAARLHKELPKLAKSVVYDKMFQGLLGDADPAAQKMVAHIVDAMTQPLNVQVDAWAQQLYGKAMEKLDPYIKTQLKMGRATISLSATDIRGTIDGVMRLQTVTDMISGPLADAMGESAFGEMQTRLSSFLNGKLPPELEAALYKGPDAVDAMIAKGENYLPSAQLNALKAKMLALPILTIPNEVYGGMLAGSAARHFVLAFAEFPVVNEYELQRGVEVTNVMVWQIKNKSGFNMSLGQLLDMANNALGQVGGLAGLGRVGKTIAQAKEQFEAVEEKVKAIESKVKDPIERASKEFRAQVDEIKQALLDFQADLAAPVNEWIEGVDQGLKEGASQIKAHLPEGVNGIPGTWEEIRSKLGIPDKPFGKFGDKSVLDNAGVVDAAQKINANVSDAMAAMLVDAAQALLPSPVIKPEEKVPAQNPDEEGDYDPVLLHNGEFTHPVVDVEIPGRGINLQFKRIYRSRSQFMGRLGWNWTHNFEEALRTWESPDGPGLTWIDGNGRKYFFKVRADHPGEFVAPAGVFAELKTIRHDGAKGFELRERGGFVTRFDHSGFLQEKCDRYGNCLRSERDASGTLNAIIDTVGRRMQFSYDGVGRLTQLADTSGRIWKYDYDVRGDLVRVVSPSTDAFPKGIATEYAYDTHRMTQIRDPRGNVFLKNAYGTTGFFRDQIVSQQYGGPHNRVKSRFVLLRPAWVVARWPDVMNVAVDRLDLRDRRGVVKRFWHNVNGNLLRHEVVDARGKVHLGMRYTYNGDGMRVREQRPSGLTLENIYYNGNERMLRGVVVKRVEAPLRRKVPGGDKEGMGEVGCTNSRKSEYRYDNRFGDLIYQKSPDDFIREWTFDDRGAMLEEKVSTPPAPPYKGGRINVKYHHNTHGQLTAIEDPRGTLTAYAYDGANLTSIVRDARGRKITTRYAYDAVGNITAITLPNGGVRWFDVDAQNLIRREITPLGHERRYEYDAHGNVTAMHVNRCHCEEPATKQSRWLTGLLRCARNDITYHFGYDILDRLILRQEPIDGTRVASTRYAYDPDGRLSDVTFPEGNRLHMTYDAWGRSTVVERGAGTRDAVFTQYQYDADGNLVGEVDGLGRLTEVERNAFGEVVAVIHPNGTRMELERDVAGNVVTQRVRDQAGAILSEARIQSDPLGASQRILEWDSARSAWRAQESRYDFEGNLLSVVTPTGATTRYDYDALGNRTRVRYPENIFEEWQYNELELPIKYTSPMLGEVGRRPGEGETHFIYDLQGRLVSRTDPNSAVTQFSYDDRDNLLEEIPPEGAAVRYGYDGLGRRTWVAQAERVTRYDWDGNGRLRTLTDPLGRTTHYVYDAADRLSSERFPDGGMTTMAYDTNNQVKRRCMPNGSCVVQDFDAMGNVISRHVKNIRQQFQYDGLGRLVSAREGDRVALWAYSSLSDVMESTQGPRRLRKIYDANGRTSGMQFSDGKAVQWRRDGLGRITQVDGPDGFRVAQTWGVFGPEKIQYGNDRTDAMAHDGMGNIVRIGRHCEPEGRGNPGCASGIASAAPRNDIQYVYNLLGNLISQDSTVYIYDPWQQLIQAGDARWQYDLNGGRAPSVDLTFDKNGNMTSDGRNRYIYDALDRLQEVRDADGKVIARYTYDALNRRITKEAAGHTTEYLYDGWEPVEIYDDGKLSQQFIRGDDLDESFGAIVSAAPQYFHRDRMGSVVAVSDPAGNITQQFRYDPFGSTESSPSPLGGEGRGEGLARRFTGQLYDAETGLYYMRNRYYSPQSGQFLTRDPLGYKNMFHAPSALMRPFSFSFHQYLGSAPRVSLVNHVNAALMDTNLFATIPTRHNGTSVETNLHMYVGNNPMNGTDPLGLYVLRLNRALDTMMLFDQYGKEVGVFEARTEGAHRNRSVRKGDTPNGIYDVTTVAGGVRYRHSGIVNGTKLGPAAYGLGYIGLSPVLVEPGAHRRGGLAIHGGGSGLKNALKNKAQGWVNTFGCVRMQNDEIIQLVNSIRQLKSQGDTDGTLLVYDGSLAENQDSFNHRIRTDTRYWPPSMAQVAH